MGRILFTDGIFHSGKTETDVFHHMAVERGRIVGTYRSRSGAGLAGRFRFGGSTSTRA